MEEFAARDTSDPVRNLLLLNFIMVLLLPRLLADLPKASWEEVNIPSQPARPQEPMPTKALLYHFPFLFISGKYKHISFPTIADQVQLCGLILVLSLSERKFSGEKSPMCLRQCTNLFIK